MDTDAYPSLDAFKIIQKITISSESIWVGTLRLAGTVYRAIYRENRDILELTRYKRHYFLTPIKNIVNNKYILIAEPDSNLLLTLDVKNNIIDAQTLNKDDYGFHFK